PPIAITTSPDAATARFRAWPIPVTTTWSAQGFAALRFSPGRIASVTPPAVLAPRCAAAITPSRPPVTTVQPHSARRRPNSSADVSHSAPLPTTATWMAIAVVSMTRGATGGTWRNADSRRWLRRRLRRAPLEETGRNDRLARELHALHAAPARDRLGHDRAAPRRRPVAGDVPARRARPRSHRGARPRGSRRDRRLARRTAGDRVRPSRRRPGGDDAHLARPRARRARHGLQGPRGRDRPPQPRPPAARTCLDRPGRPRRARFRLRRGGLRRCGGARGAQRHGERSSALLPRTTRRPPALGARRRRTEDPS